MEKFGILAQWLYDHRYSFEYNQDDEEKPQVFIRCDGDYDECYTFLKSLFDEDCILCIELYDEFIVKL